jgi:hypothetical protein
VPWASAAGRRAFARLTGRGTIGSILRIALRPGRLPCGGWDDVPVRAKGPRTGKDATSRTVICGGLKLLLSFSGHSGGARNDVGLLVCLACNDSLLGTLA